MRHEFQSGCQPLVGACGGVQAVAIYKVVISDGQRFAYYGHCLTAQTTLWKEADTYTSKHSHANTRCKV
jgi:hypothetical protein